MTTSTGCPETGSPSRFHPVADNPSGPIDEPCGGAPARSATARAPLVSVIIPVYNVEAYLEECLRSVLSQDIANIEVIVVDDASPDGSRNIAERIAATDDRVVIVSHPENRGLGPARNTGVRNAQGTYLLFLDSDDMLASPDALGQLVSAAQKKNCQVVVGSCEQLMPDGSIVEYDRAHDRLQHGRPGTVYSGKEAFLGVLGAPEAPYLPMRAWGALIERSFYNDIDLDYPPGEHEDMAHTPFLCFGADGVYYEPKVVIRYRVRENSLSRSPWSLDKVRRYELIWRETAARMERFGLSEELDNTAAIHAGHLTWRIDINGLQPGADSEYYRVLSDILQHLGDAPRPDITFATLDRIRRSHAGRDPAVLRSIVPAPLLLAYHRSKLGITGASATRLENAREDLQDAIAQKNEALFLCDQYLTKQEELYAQLRQSIDACNQLKRDRKGRSIWRALFFRTDGRPVKPLRIILFHNSGKPRGIFRRYILNSAGEPRKAFRLWMTSPAYLSLRRAVRHHR